MELAWQIDHAPLAAKLQQQNGVCQFGCGSHPLSESGRASDGGQGAGRLQRKDWHAPVLSESDHP